MAINATVYDLEGYSENSKTVTLDLLKVVPIGAAGDEKFILTCRTTAYSDLDPTKVPIDDIFIQEFLCGWAKSSGFKGAMFTINSGNKELKVKIDNVSTAQLIVLEEGVLTGDVIATDIQTKLRALSKIESGVVENNLGYMNCKCSFTNSRFVIKSGTISKTLSGGSASSVVIASASANTVLGFDLPVQSIDLAETDIRESRAAAYTAGTSVLTISPAMVYTPGDSMCITCSGTTNYFTAISGTATEIQVATLADHGFDGISNSYTGGGVVQRLQYNDPEYTPTSCLLSVDDALTWGIMSLANQIDFSG